MGNPKELRRARKMEALAIESRVSIEGLPRRVGQRVRWSNGVVWTRLGDNVWQPDDDSLLRYDSAHVARGDWALLQ